MKPEGERNDIGGVAATGFNHVLNITLRSILYSDTYYH